MVRITKQRCAFPADILLLQSSSNQGLCNIETANLDGETNLKIKQAVGHSYALRNGEFLGEQKSNEEEVADPDPFGDCYPFSRDLQFKLESEYPHENISKWLGTLQFGDEEPISVGMNQFLLRGCTLRNTDWVIGIVVFTGTETKIALNNKEMPFKRSNVDVIVDRVLYFIFGAQQIMCLFGIIAHLLWLRGNADNHWYQYINSDGSNWSSSYQMENAALNYFTFLVLLDLFVPISLYVSMEMVKVAQAVLINSDKEMCLSKEHEDDPLDEHGEPRKATKVYAKARTSNLNEELGQISFIFSDKTGTLTENKMEFLRCAVDGVRYGPDEMTKQDQFVERIATPANMPPFDDARCRFTDNRFAHKTRRKIRHSRDEPLESRRRGVEDEFATLLSVCHSIIAEYPNGRDHGVVYNASSPDEKALVLMAKNIHYFFYDGHVQMLDVDGHDATIDGHRFYVNIFGTEHEFDIYNMLEFSSDRKRMSVICRDPRDQTLKLYCKGADNVVFQRLHSDYKNKGDEEKMAEWESTLDALQHFAADGLRTLVCGYRVIADEEYRQWLGRLTTAQQSMENRAVMIDAVYDEIEHDLTLLGATAIEDKLQQGVPETIANLAVAGISIWVLTGDKVETAINIGRSAKLLSNKMNRLDGSLYVIDPDEDMDEAECETQVRADFDEAWEFLKDRDNNDPDQGFVISGKALSCVFPHRKHDSRGREIPPNAEEAGKEEEFQGKILRILQKCRAVICCRVSPIQKAQMVFLVKNNVPNTISLAIGDGANDVPMIRAAHVGIGISGQEGLQAVMASDYAIAQFRFLRELLLIHGAWDYRRISILILYSFYKNIMFSMSQIWFSFYCGYSGTLFYDAFSGSLYNLVFTGFPVLLGATFDRPYSKEIARLCPELYGNGPANGSFNLRIFAFWSLQGVLHSMVVFWTATEFMDSKSIYGNGHTVGFWTTCSTMFTSIVVIATFKMMLETRTWTKWSILAFVLSLFLWFLWLLVYGVLPPDMGTLNDDVYGVPAVGMAMPQWWFITVIALTLAMIPDVLYKYITRMYLPTRLNMIEELELYPPKRKKFIDRIRKNQRRMARESVIQQEEDIANGQQTHLGYSDFQVGHDHPDYVMSQKHYLDLAMNKPRFSQIRRIVSGIKKKTKKQKQPQRADSPEREDSTRM